MALFSKTKRDVKTEKKADAPKVADSKATVIVHTNDLSGVLKHARITEKATMHSSASVYVFDVAENASKQQISAAVKKIYSVTPKMVRVTMVPAKIRRSARTGKTGLKKGGKKAYVYLKKGETINL